MTLGVATIALSALLVPGDVASATYEPGEPEVTWGVQVDLGWFEYFSDIDTAEGVVWSVGYTSDGNGDTQGIVTRHNAHGRELSRIVDAGNLTAGANAVDAGEWGAVVVGARDETGGYVERFAADGSLLWTVPAGADGERMGVQDVTVRGDTVYVLGFQGDWNRVDAYALETGGHQRSHSFGQLGTQGHLSTIESVGDEIVAGGSVFGELVPGEHVGDRDNALIAVDSATFETRWTRQFGTQGMDFISDLTERDGVLYWAGTLGNQDNHNSFSPLVGGLGAFTPDGTSLWRKKLGPGYAVVRALTSTSEGLVTAGEVEPGALGEEVAGFGQRDAFVQGWGFSGETLWTEVYGSREYDMFTSLAADGDRLYAGGVTDGRMFAEGDGPRVDGVLVALDVPHLQRPDLSLRTGRSYEGDNRYGKSRTIRLGVRPGERRSATLRLEDDGLIGDRLTLRSCEVDRHLKLKFTQGQRDVTATTRNGTYRTRALRPGGAQRLTFTVSADRRAHGAHRCVLTSRSNSRAHEVDRLRLRIVIRR